MRHGPSQQIFLDLAAVRHHRRSHSWEGFVRRFRGNGASSLAVPRSLVGRERNEQLPVG